jgi:DNA-binding MarR family transcriptional regulator
MTDNPAELIAQILDLNSQTQRRLKAGWPDAWLTLTLPLGAIRALLAIENGTARTPREVADVLKISRTSVTGTLDRLEAEKLTTRTLDPNDRRSFMLDVTDAGRDLARQIAGGPRERLHAALLLMDAESLSAFQKGLSALSQAINACESQTIASEKEVNQ